MAVQHRPPGVPFKVPDCGLSPRLAFGTTPSRLVWTPHTRGLRTQTTGHLPYPGRTPLWSIPVSSLGVLRRVPLDGRTRYRRTSVHPLQGPLFRDLGTEFARARHPRAVYLFTSQQGNKVPARTFTHSWRDPYHVFVNRIPDFGLPSQCNFYPFRNSLVVYLAINCDFSFLRRDRTYPRHRGSKTTALCYAAGGDHLAVLRTSQRLVTTTTLKKIAQALSFQLT